MVIFTSDPRPNAFTDRQERLIEAIERFPGRAELENRWRALRPWQHPSLNAVSTVSDWLSTMPGHKALVFVSEYVGCRLIDPNPVPAGRIGDEDLCRIDLMKATHDAVRASASIYTIDPRGLMPIAAGGAEHEGGVGGVRQLRQLSAAEMVRQQPLRALSDDTGGFALVGSNGFDDAFDRLVRENSTYYVIGYYATNDRHDGTFRKNEVRVNRRALTVKYRRGYIAPRMP
jgi:VWFA-related protein